MWVKNFSTLVLLCILGHLVQAQNGAVVSRDTTVQKVATIEENPFELTHRLRRIQKPNGSQVAIPPSASIDVMDSLQPQDSTPVELVAQEPNPFEIVRPVKPLTSLKAKAEEAPLSPESALARDWDLPLPQVNALAPPAGKNFLFVTFCVIIVLMTVSISLFWKSIGQAFRALSNEHFLSQLFRSQGSFIRPGILLMYLAYWLNLGLFLYLLGRQYHFSLGTDLGTLLGFTGLIAAILLAKHLLLGILSLVFPPSKEYDLYNFSIVVFGFLSGIFLAPINILLLFGPEPMRPTIIGVVAIMLATVIVIRTLRGMALANRMVFGEPFQFFIYLCAVEIAPALILTKWVLLQTSIQ